MSKKNVTLKVEANTKEAVKGINDVNKKLDKLGKDDTVTKLSKLGSIASGVQAGFSMLSGAVGVATAAIGKVNEVIGETVQLYNIQAKAETQLEVAAKNNPYLNAESVNSLKNYASELQSIGEIGDESLLPMMAELAASGRTQEQIQSIMKAALNASATGMISMDSAVKALNGSLNGSVGSIGKLLPNLKNLSKEELESGKAIEEVQKAFDGMSEATANPMVQLQNAWGDFKEIIGGGFATIINPVAKFCTTLVNGISGAAQVLKDFWKTVTSLGTGEDTPDLSNLGENSIGELEAKLAQASGKLADFNNQVSNSEQIVASLREQLGDTAEELDATTTAAIDATAAEVERLRQIGGRTNEMLARDLEDIDRYNSQINEFNEKIAENQRQIQSLSSVHTSEAREQIRSLERANDTFERKIRNLENLRRNAQNELNTYQHLLTAQARESALSASNVASQNGPQAQLRLEQQNLEYAKERRQEQEAIVAAIQAELESRRQANAEEARRQQQAERQAENDTKVSDALKVYKEAVNTKKSELQARKDLGEQISQSAEAQELLNTKTSAYITFWQEVGTLGTTQAAKIRADIEKTAELIEDAPEKVKSKYEQWTEEISREMGRIDVELDFDLENKIDTTQLKESMKNLQDLLKERLAEIKGELSEMEVAGINTDEQKKKYDELLKLYDDYAKKREEVAREITKLEGEEGETQLEKIQKVIDKTMECLSTLSNSLKSFSDLFTEMYENQAKTQIAELDKTYSEGEMSLEDYNKQKEKIEKESAQKAYKIQMWAWSAQVVQAMASVAQGMVQALSDPIATTPALKIANMAMVGAAGAANIATVIANKPIPPSFATGGIVGGSSYHGDKVQANVNSGEMILNAQQQRALWETANGKGAMGGPQLKVTVKNFMGDSAQVSQSINNDELVMTVTRIVNKGLQDGSLRDGLTAGMNGLDGDVYVS